MPKRLVYRFGNRGIVLLMLGVIWASTGVGMIAGPERKLNLPEDHIPQEWRGLLLWLLPGLFAMVVVAFKRTDATAWGLLMLGPATRFCNFVIAWVLGMFDVLPPFPFAWLGVLVWAAVVIMLDRSAAGLDRPPVRPGDQVGWI